jgi:hypothetical protein
VQHDDTIQDTEDKAPKSVSFSRQGKLGPTGLRLRGNEFISDITERTAVAAVGLSRVLRPERSKLR